jgi:hypothetical protein
MAISRQMGVAVMVPVVANALTLPGDVPAASTAMQAEAQATQQPTESPFNVQPPE